MTKALSRPSEHFDNALITSGSIRAACDFCGREHFTDDEGAGSWEPGELEKLRQCAKDNHDKYVVHAGSVLLGEIDGRTAVIDCPCNQLRKFEDWIWMHRFMIAKYLKTRSADELQGARLAQAVLGDIQPIVDPF